MYKPHGELDGIGGGPMVALPFGLPVVGPSSGVPTPPRNWRRRMEQRFRKLDLVHDLAEDIGSVRWYRGFVTMIALGIAALAFWPDFSAVEAATTIHPDAEMRGEYDSQTIAPLAFGADSGRRNAPGAAVRPLASVPERASIQLVATLGQNDGFAHMLQRAGVGAYDASLASQMVGAVMPIGDVKPGTRFDLTLGARPGPGEPRTLDKLTFRARFDLDLTVERQGAGLSIIRHPIAVDTSPLRIRGTVGSSLFRSARAAGAPIKAIEQYLQTIAAHLSLDGDVAPTDQFDMIVDYKRASGGENEVGNLVYAGLERDGKPLAELLRWKGGQFVDAASMNQPAVLSQGMIQPVHGHITSLYGMRRHPILGYVRMHSGVDFGAPWGSPIYAVSDGIVSFAGRHGGHGNYVRLEHGGGLGTGYGHMSRIAVSVGARVHAGEVIGYVGSTGLSTGPHLHYEVYENGHTVNPLAVGFTIRTAGMDKDQLDAMKSKIAQLKESAAGTALQKLSPG